MKPYPHTFVSLFKTEIILIYTYVSWIESLIKITGAVRLQTNKISKHQLALEAFDNNIINSRKQLRYYKNANTKTPIFISLFIYTNKNIIRQNKGNSIRCQNKMVSECRIEMKEYALCRMRLRRINKSKDLSREKSSVFSLLFLISFSFHFLSSQWLC